MSFYQFCRKQELAKAKLMPHTHSLWKKEGGSWACEHRPGQLNLGTECSLVFMLVLDKLLPVLLLFTRVNNRKNCKIITTLYVTKETTGKQK